MVPVLELVADTEDLAAKSRLAVVQLLLTVASAVPVLAADTLDPEEV